MKKHKNRVKILLCRWTEMLLGLWAGVLRSHVSGKDVTHSFTLTAAEDSFLHLLPHLSRSSRQMKAVERQDCY